MTQFVCNVPLFSSSTVAILKMAVKVVCVSADQFAGSSLTAKKNSKDGRGERGHLLEPAIKKEKVIMLGLGELSSQVVWNKLLWVLS